MKSKEEIIQSLTNLGITCNSCWWREGDRCYFGEPEREPCGRSKTHAISVCENHSNKRTVLEKFFPKDMLVITSEENQKKKGNDKGNY